MEKNERSELANAMAIDLAIIAYNDENPCDPNDESMADPAPITMNECIAVLGATPSDVFDLTCGVRAMKAAEFLALDSQHDVNFFDFWTVMQYSRRSTKTRS